MFTYFAEIRLAIVCALVGLIIFLVARHVRAQTDVLRAHMEGRNRLLDRFGDAEAFLAFARTEEGRTILRPPDLGAGASRVPGLRLLQSAIVCLALGVGFKFFVSGQEGPGIGVVLLSAGAGQALAGLLAWFTQRTSGGQRS
jgi:hypothetical protein